MLNIWDCKLENELFAQIEYQEQYGDFTIQSVDLDGFHGEHKNHRDAIFALKWIIANKEKIEIIDVETTGVEPAKEAVEVAIRNLDTGCQWQKYFVPFCDLDPRAVEFHGLSKKNLFGLGAKNIRIRDIKEIRRKFTDSYAACANVQFYFSALNNSFRAAGETRLLLPKGVLDLGWLFSDFYDLSKSLKWSGSALSDLEKMVEILNEMVESANLDWSLDYFNYKYEKIKYLRMY